MSTFPSTNKKQNYQIISLIGQGAYGQVYKARKKFTGQFVAIKSIKKKGKQEKDIKAMRQEIEILKKLKHENIILLLDSFETNSQFILVTELGQGELFNIIEDDQSLEIDEIRKIAQQTVRALHYIHSNRITHRDLKPQNILMTSDGIIKLCDFGFARSMSYKTQVLTSLKGTPLYMAPEVVKQEPYNHTADLWSLGVILYQLATGNPPFTAPNLITLVDHISKDPIHYPDFISGEFKSFLKGLLNKDPKRRLGWPQLLQHPFIKENQEERRQRKEKSERFSSWIEDNVINQEQLRLKNPQAMNSKYVPSSSFDERRELSPLKAPASTNCKGQPQKNNISSESGWAKYLSMATDELGCQNLRSDSKFLQNVLEILELSMNDLIREKEKRQNLALATKTLVQVLMKSKSPEETKSGKKIDIGRNFNIPTGLLKILKNLLKVDHGRQYVEILSDIIKVIGLLARVTFQKNLGIQMIYIRSFLPLFPEILSSIYKGPNNESFQNYTINFLRTIGMFANNASCNHIRSFSFYKDLVELKVIQQSIGLVKHLEGSPNVLKLYIQVLSALIHPVFGDIECFPWRKENYAQFKEFLTMAECVRLSIVNVLLENSYAQIFEVLLHSEDESSILPKISTTRIILQSIRLSREFADSLINDKKLFQSLLETFLSRDQLVYSASCYSLTLCVKHIIEKNQQAVFQDSFDYIFQVCLKNLTSSLTLSLKELKKHNQLVVVYCSLHLLYQLLNLQNRAILQKIFSLIISENFHKFSAAFLGDCGNNKLEEMRKVEGSNYGIHPFGIYDSLFLLLHRFNTRALQELDKKSIDLYVNSLTKNRMLEKIPLLLENLSSKTDLSPRGFVAYLIYIGDLLSVGLLEPFTAQKFLLSLVDVLRQEQINNLKEWPINFGGGQNCLTIVFGNISILILTLLRHSQRFPSVPMALSKSRLVEYTVKFAKYLDKETVISLVSILGHLIVLDRTGSEKSEKQGYHFARQFITCGGMTLFCRFDLLNIKQYSSSALMQNCNFLSLLAKISKQYYQHIDSLKPYEMILQMLNSEDAQLRAKVLNMVGNMCRHSSYFYSKIQQSGILHRCIKLCEDSDKNVKKFACVAIGNACFHDASLYHVLRPSIPILVNLLKDAEEKMRSNAAAALGNLARNSKDLDKDFVKSGANFQLAGMIQNQKSIACKKVCVMAVMNLLGLLESGRILIEQKIQEVLRKYIPPSFTGDPALIKVCQKALDKIQKRQQQGFD